MVLARSSSWAKKIEWMKILIRLLIWHDPTSTPDIYVTWNIPAFNTAPLCTTKDRSHRQHLPHHALWYWTQTDPKADCNLVPGWTFRSRWYRHRFNPPDFFDTLSHCLHLEVSDWLFVVATPSMVSFRLLGFLVIRAFSLPCHLQVTWKWINGN